MNTDPPSAAVATTPPHPLRWAISSLIVAIGGQFYACTFFDYWQKIDRIRMTSALLSIFLAFGARQADRRRRLAIVAMVVAVLTFLFSVLCPTA